MYDSIKINPISKVNGNIILPGSKSISNRALIIAAQAVGITKLNNLLLSDDTYHMLNALSKLGINYSLSKKYNTCEIEGIGGPLYSKKSIILFVGNSGITARLLIAALSIRKCKDIIITGNKRMENRPIKYLIDSLIQGGAKIEYLNRNYFLPIKIYGGFLGGTIEVKSNISSQFLTALLIMTPMAKINTKIYIKGKLVSRPYIDITLKVMQYFGIFINHNCYKEFYIKKSLYKSMRNFLVESDISSASYFLSAAAIKGGTVRINGIGKNTIQGDIYFTKVLKKMGAKIDIKKDFISCTRNTLQSIDMDMNDIPDSAMTIAITSLFVKNRETSILRNIYSWQFKESNRLLVMANELNKLGAKILKGKDYIAITPPLKINKATINTHDDHRIAMCFSLAALSGVPITILNHRCVSKTFPDFFIKFFSLVSS